MADATDYLEGELIEWLIDGTDFDPSPGNIYVGLHTGDPGEGGGANEVGAADYERYNSTASTDWNIPSTGSFENASDFVFVEAQSDWGTISHFSLWDSKTGGNALAKSPLQSNITVTTGDSPVFRDGNLTGTFD